MYHLSFLEIINDRFKYFLKYLRWNIDPLIYLSKKKSSLIIGGTFQVKTRLNVPDNKFKFLSTIGSETSIYKFEVKSKSQFIIVSVGRLVKIKGFDLILQSFKKFSDSLRENNNEPAVLMIVGDGPEKKKLQEMVTHFDFDRNEVIFTGWLQKYEINEIYNAASCYISASFEGGGAVVAEAMSYGLPIVCFDGYGASSIVDESCSIKVRSNSRKEDIEEFVIALHRLYGDKYLAKLLGEGSRNKFIRDLSWESKGKELYNLLSLLK